MSQSRENTPIYFEAMRGWMEAHQGRMPGAVSASRQPEDDIVVDTPYMDDVAENGISFWGRNRALTEPRADLNPSQSLSPRTSKPKQR